MESGGVEKWRGGEWRDGGGRVVGWLSGRTEHDSKEMNWNHV